MSFKNTFFQELNKKLISVLCRDSLHQRLYTLLNMTNTMTMADTMIMAGTRPSTRTNTRINTNSSPTTKTDILIVACTCLFTLICVAGTIAWTVFAIIALVSESHHDIIEKCDCTSHLWAYLIAVIVWSFTMSRVVSDCCDKKEDLLANACAAVFLVLCELGMICWGMYELLHDNVRNTLGSNKSKVYYVTAWWVYFQVAIISVFLLGLLTYVICKNNCCGLLDCYNKVPKLDKQTQHMGDIEDGGLTSEYSPHGSPRTNPTQVDIGRTKVTL